jgi:Protein of unknown function (DUF3305)
MQRPSVTVAVVMRKAHINNRWQPWQWGLHAVMIDEGSFGSEPRCLLKSEGEEQWLFPGYVVELFEDDAEGYYLNVTTDAPGFWVQWRMEEETSIDAELLAVPHAVTLSYHEAGRWLDAQMQTEQVAASREVAQWVRDFSEHYFVPELKQRQRPQSFKTLTDRFGNPAKVSTEEKRKGTPKAAV